jgi:hypothetical protein
MSGNRRGVAEAKLRIRSQKPQESLRVPRIDRPEQTLPPRLIGLKDVVWFDSHL